VTVIFYSPHRDKHSHKGPSRTVDQRVVSFTPKIKFDVVHICLPVDLCVCENAFIFVSWLPKSKQEVSDIVRSGS